MNYGGEDISRSLLWLLKQSTTHFFPYSKCNWDSPYDREIIRRLKESLCHFRKVVVAKYSQPIEH